MEKKKEEDSNEQDMLGENLGEFINLFVPMVRCGTPHGKRRLGWLQLRWEDPVRNNVQIMDPNADMIICKWDVLAIGWGK